MHTSDSDRQLREAIRNLYLAQSELESLKRSAGYKIARRARRALDFFLPPSGWSDVINRAFRRALNIWLDEGAPMVVWRSAFKFGRILQQWLGIAAEDRQAKATAKRRALARSLVALAEEKKPVATTGRRSNAEIAHLIGRCQRCRNFTGESCRLMPAGEPLAAKAVFAKTLADRAAGCPSGAWQASETSPITRLNLVYHVTPIQHPEDIWRWNVGELLKRIDHFNGRRIITVVTSGQGRAMDPPEAVVEAFSGHDVEFRFAPNDPNLREAAHFFSALREIASVDPSEAVFYGHCKGVSHLDQSAVRPWTAAMYHHNLDRIDEIRDLLGRWPCVGIAKRYGQFENLTLGRPRRKGSLRRRRWHGWHFAGTFWWVRHDRLFSQPDWDQIPLHPYAVEAYLAHFFNSDEALCLEFDGIQDPYNPLVWQDAAA